MHYLVLNITKFSGFNSLQLRCGEQVTLIHRAAERATSKVADRDHGPCLVTSGCRRCPSRNCLINSQRASQWWVVSGQGSETGRKGLFCELMRPRFEAQPEL